MNFPRVSSEGGPILLADFEALRSWRGASDSSGHYEAACRPLDGGNPSTMRFGGTEIIVWDFGGPGTGELVQVDERHISVVRIWPDPALSEAELAGVILSSATAPASESIVAHLDISSGYLLALWAPEDMSECAAPEGAQGALDQLSIGDGGAYLRVACGRYAITGREWTMDKCEITKLDLRRIGEGASLSGDSW